MKANNIKSYINFIKKPTVLFVIFTLIGSFIFFLRFPNNFTEPNFYAEDGSTFLKNILENGFLGALFTSFNGYFVMGLYMLEGLGFIVNFVAQREFIDLAGSFAIASYLFLGTVAALPFLLFKRHFNFFALLITFFLVAFVPLPGSDYAVIGTVGNAKFVFVYIALLLLIYRHLTAEEHWKNIIIADFFILVCAYTNIVVYPLMLFALIKYIPYFKKHGFLSLFRLRSVQSLIALGVLLLPQLIYMKVNGLPAMPGYLDTPYEPSSTINMFVFRSYLFPFLGPVIKSLNDLLAILAFSTLVGGLWYSLRKRREILIFCLTTIFIITFLFVANRTGVSSLFLAYASGGPDQFFYTQNMIICFVVGLGIFELVNRAPSTLIRNSLWVGLSLLIVLVYIPHSGSFGKNDFMEQTVGNIYLNAQKECTESGPINLQLYPIESDSFQLKNQNRAEICTDKIVHYVPAYDRLGLVSGSTYANITSTSDIEQTFVANYNGLNAVRIQFLNYKTQTNGKLTLQLFDAACSHILRSATIGGNTIRDARYATFSFTPLNESRNSTYCYKLTTDGLTTPLAVSLSAEDKYTKGLLTIGGVSQNDDLMMELGYAR